MSTFTTYDHLPKSMQSALSELEQFIGELDGKDVGIETGNGCFIDDGTVDVESAVAAFNEIVGALGLVPLTDEQKQELRATRCPGGGFNGQPEDQEPTVQACLDANSCGCIFGERAR